MYILKEIYMNGTFTMNTFITGIDTKEFDDAKKIVENVLINRGINFEILEDTGEIYRYKMNNNFSGIMENKQLVIIK
jgi:hypothetical protein